jgi:hypothetical protein
MRLLTALLTFALFGVCLAAKQSPDAMSADKEPVYQGKTLGHWIALARNKAPALRLEAVSALRNIGPKAVPALAELLKDKDRQIRQAAASALGEIGFDANPAVPTLIELLRDEEKEVRQAAVSALGKVHSR